MSVALAVLVSLSIVLTRVQLGPPVSVNSVAIVDPGSARLLGHLGVAGVPLAAVRVDGAVWLVHLADATTLARLGPPARTPAVRRVNASFASDAAAAAAVVWLATGDGLVRLSPASGRVTTIAALGSTRSRLEVRPHPDTCYSERPQVAVGGGAAWLLCRDGRLAKVDAATGRVRAVRDAGDLTTALAYGLGALWVADEDDGVVARVDPSTLIVTHRTSVGGQPGAIAVAATGVWVADIAGDTVGRLTLVGGSLTLTRTVEVGSAPLALAAGGRFVWAASGDGTVTRIDAETGKTATIELGWVPTDVLVTEEAVVVPVSDAPAP